METTDNFKAIKQEILDRARAASACREQYGRAYASKTLQELCNVIKDNFNWCCLNGVLTAELLEQCKADFATNGIYVNTDVTEGYLLAYDNATVRAYGNATVRASGNATVRAYGNATVRAYGNATVRAYGNATVRASDNATVRAYDNAYCVSYFGIDCRLSDNALYRVISTNTVHFANDNIKFQKQ